MLSDLPALRSEIAHLRMQSLHLPRDSLILLDKVAFV